MLGGYENRIGFEAFTGFGTWNTTELKFAALHRRMERKSKRWQSSVLVFVAFFHAIIRL